MTIRNVFVDFGGVLVRTEDKSVREKQAQQLGMTCYDLEELFFESETSLKASLGEIPEEAHWQALAKALRVSRPEMEQITANFFAGDRVNEPLLDYLRSLRPERKVGLISNAWEGLRRYISDHGLADVFDAMTISAEVGIMKPDERIYRLALQELDAKAEESVFVDDFRRNVEAARAIGMHAIQFTQPNDALEELQQILNNHR